MTLVWNVSPVEPPNNERDWNTSGTTCDIQDSSSYNFSRRRRWLDYRRGHAANFIRLIDAIWMRVALERLRDTLTAATLEFVIPTRCFRWQSSAVFLIRPVFAVRFSIAAPRFVNTFAVATLELVRLTTLRFAASGFIGTIRTVVVTVAYLRLGNTVAVHARCLSN